MRRGVGCLGTPKHPDPTQSDGRWQKVPWHLVRHSGTEGTIWANFCPMKRQARPLPLPGQWAGIPRHSKYPLPQGCSNSACCFFFLQPQSVYLTPHAVFHGATCVFHNFRHSLLFPGRTAAAPSVYLTVVDVRDLKATAAEASIAVRLHLGRTHTVFPAFYFPMSSSPFLFIIPITHCTNSNF